MNPPLLTCTQGHQWSVRTAAVDGEHCPVCGSPPTHGAATSGAAGADRRFVGDAGFGALLETVPSGGLAALGLGFLAVLAFAGAAFALTLPDIGMRVALLAAGALLGVVLICAAYRSGSGDLKVFEHGLVRRGLGGAVRLPFAEVSAIHLGGRWGIGTKAEDLLDQATIYGPGGREIYLGSLESGLARKAMDIILAQVVPLIVTRVLGQFAEGKPMWFGSLKLTAEGVGGHERPTAYWHELDPPSFSPEGYRIFPYGRPQATIVLPLDSPNLHVVTWLIRNRGTAWTPAEPPTASAPPAARNEPAWPGPLAEPTAITADACVRDPSPRHASFLDSAFSTKPLPADAPPQAPEQRVAGYPDRDPHLGAVVCGRPKQTELTTQLLVVVALCGIAIVVTLLIPGASAGAIVLAVIAVLCGIGAAAAYDAGLAVYQEGICTPEGSLRWDDCRHLTYALTDVYVNGGFTGRRVELTLSGTNTWISVNGKGVETEGLCQVVLDQVVPRLVIRRWQELQAGGRLTVGNVTLTRDAVEYESFWGKRRNLPLAAVRDFRAAEGGAMAIWGPDQYEPFACVKSSECDFYVFTFLLGLLRQPPAALEEAGMQ
jgi:hypothetical protein